jgi:hypothetical protein
MDGGRSWRPLNAGLLPPPRRPRRRRAAAATRQKVAPAKADAKPARTTGTAAKAPARTAAKKRTAKKKSGE